MFRIKPKFNSPTFIEFLRDMQRTMGPTVIVMDKASYHKSKKVKKWFKKNPETVPIYLPTGSPHMNDIEGKWGVTKSEISNTVYQNITEFKAGLYKALRHNNYPTNIYKKLFKRLDDAAEACIIHARRKRTSR